MPERVNEHGRVVCTRPDIKKLIVFDLDGTLAESKSALDAEMAGLLGRLLAVVKVAVISGRDFSQFEQQALTNRNLDHLRERLRDARRKVGTRL